LILFTIGALPWMHDLDKLFHVAAQCLKPGGVLLINEGHPVTNMLAAPGEPAYSPDALDKAVYSYFIKDLLAESSLLSQSCAARVCLAITHNELFYIAQH
jgi:SAM-dependent methyltransferase